MNLFIPSAVCPSARPPWDGRCMPGISIMHVTEISNLELGITRMGRVVGAGIGA